MFDYIPQFIVFFKQLKYYQIVIGYLSAPLNNWNAPKVRLRAQINLLGVVT